MCFHDGPGIRTTVFLKGCSIHCPWCSNPENLDPHIERYKNDGETGIYGRVYDPQELVIELIKDERFWAKGGGITFSGGEPLLQAEVLLPVLMSLKERDVHIAVETALFVPKKNVQPILPYIDHFIVDVKILDPDRCKKILGGNLWMYKQNIQILYQEKKIHLFRVPCCPEYTFADEDQQLLLSFFADHREIPVQIFPIHRLGEKKYETLGKKMWESIGVENESLEAFCRLLKVKGIDAEICRI